MSRSTIPDDIALQTLARRVGERLQATGEMLATAESCTGGWVAKVVTDIAGSSAWFDRGFVTYTNAAKQEMLGVPDALLARHGAVSEPVVRAMAEGALDHGQAARSLAISGIAGPTGGTPEKPVGLVWFAWGHDDGGTVRLRSAHRVFSGDREAVRRQAVAAALTGLLDGFEP